MMSMETSIVITAYRRPAFLKECIEAALSQTLPPCEIIIGDDSPEDENRAVAEALQKTTNIPLRYYYHRPTLTQATNVEFLFAHATGKLTCLIHDDDLLLPNALADLVPAFSDPQVVGAFGRQKIISHEGVEDPSASENLNKAFDRTAAWEGRQDDSLRSALTQQWPNNGFVVRTAPARAVGYGQLHDLFGDACDFGFGLLLAFGGEGRFYFKNSYTACYRLSNQSLWRNNPRSNFAYFAFRFVASDPRIDRQKAYAQKWLKERAPAAVAEAAKLGHHAEAWQWYWGRWHRGRILTPGGLKRLWQLLRPLSVLQQG